MMVKKPKSEIIKERAVKHGLLFIKRDATIRSVAKESGFTKSTVHLDLHRLETIHPELFDKVMEKLNFNFAVKHIRGGEATKKMYRKGDK